MTSPFKRMLQHKALFNMQPKVDNDRVQDAAVEGAIGFGRGWWLKTSTAAACSFVALLAMGVVMEPKPSFSADTSAEMLNTSASPITSEYRLGVRDKVKVQVYEWRPARDEVYTWTAINQEYRVDSAGNLTMPLIGQIRAAGYTTLELGTLISRRLAHRLNLSTIPDSSVEVSEYRPVFVAGHVERSGEFAYAPGMTILQAVSLGGGLYRGAGTYGLRLEREYLTVAGEYDRQMQERVRLMVRKARLDAELAFADRIAFPADVRTTRNDKSLEYTSSLMAKEQSVFELRQKAYETQVTTLNQLQSFLEQEVDTISKRLEAHQTQIDLMKSELGGIKNLTDKGLATQPRLLGLQRNLAQLEGDRLRMESDRTRAMQDVSRAKLSRIEFDNRRANDLTVDLQQVEGRLEQVVQEASVSEQLLLDTQAQAAASPLRLVSVNSANKTAKPEVKYTIVRQLENETMEIEATENSQLLPGDTVKVTISVPAMTDAGRMLDVNGSAQDAPAQGGSQSAPAINIDVLKAPQRVSVEPINTSVPSAQ